MANVFPVVTEPGNKDSMGDWSSNASFCVFWEEKDTMEMRSIDCRWEINLVGSCCDEFFLAF
eukprot:11090946-Ditylum_brightwellii.AAC.1